MDYFGGSKSGGRLGQRISTFLQLQVYVNEVPDTGIKSSRDGPFGRRISLGKMDRPGGAVVGV